VLDVGANIGYYTLIAAPRCHSVYAFEPVSSIYERLILNRRLNNFDNVYCVNSACSDVDGERIYVYAADETNTGSSSIIKPPNFSGIVEEVECITLDKFVERENVPYVSVVKIDVEGMEAKVLRGMKEILTNDSPIIVVEIGSEERFKLVGESKNELHKYLQDLGYVPFRIAGKNKIERINGFPPQEADILFRKE